MAQNAYGSNCLKVLFTDTARRSEKHTHTHTHTHTQQKQTAYLLLFYDFVAIIISSLMEKNSSQTSLMLSGFCYKTFTERKQKRNTKFDVEFMNNNWLYFHIFFSP